MFQLILKNFKTNMGQIIFQMVELAVMFLLANAVFVSGLSDWSLKNYYQGDEELYILSGGLNHLKSGQHSKDRIHEIEQIQGVEAVGWEKQFFATIGKVENGKECSATYFSPEMEKTKCRLTAGKWFDDSKENQVILGGNSLARGYQIGDTIIVNGVSCTVIGKMSGYGRFLSTSKAVSGADVPSEQELFFFL